MIVAERRNALTENTPVIAPRLTQRMAFFLGLASQALAYRCSATCNLQRSFKIRPEVKVKSCRIRMTSFTFHLRAKQVLAQVDGDGSRRDRDHS